MRFRSAVFVGIFCLLSAVASADITSVAPSSFTPSGEDFLSIFGTNLTGTNGTFVIYDDSFVVEPQDASPGLVIAWIPVEILLQEGQHSVQVQSIDAAGVRLHGPAFFTVESAPLTGPPFVNTPEVLVVEAEDAAGANVTYDVVAASQDGTPLTPACDHPSGSHFVRGSTTVQCSASDAGGTTTATFLVIVADSTPPELTMPADITQDDPVVTFDPTAVDNIDGPVPVTCSPASGSTFPTGTTNVRCVARDSSLNETIAILVVKVTSGAPLLNLPDDITAEATSAAGAVVDYTVTIDGTGTFACTPPSGSTFALGTTAVNCTATNAQGSTSGSFNVTVQDTTAPDLTTPTEVIAEATSASGAIVTWTATAHDLVDGDRPVTCDPASGSQFPLGTTTVVCTASDTRGNDASNAFDVTVQDTTPPVITNISATPNSLWPPNHRMAPIAISATAVDAVDPAPVTQVVSVSSNQPVNGTGDGDTAPDWEITGPFSVNVRAERAGGSDRIYTITVDSTDSAGNVGSATVTVTVRASKGRAIH